MKDASIKAELKYKTRANTDTELEEGLARVSVRDLRSNLSEILNEADYSDREIVITKRGHATLVLVPARKYAEFKKSKKELRSCEKRLEEKEMTTEKNVA